MINLKDRLLNNKKNILLIVLTDFIIGFISCYATYRVVYKGDYIVHESIIRNIANNPQKGWSLVPHPTYHYIMALIVKITQIKHIFPVQIIFTGVCFVLVFNLSYLAFRKIAKVNTGKAIVLAIIICIYNMPYNVFTNTFYISQPAGSIYHNPTYILMKPFALLHFLVLSMMLSTEQYKKKNRLGLWSSLILAFVTTIKPNYTIGIVPVFIAWQGYLLYKTKELKNISINVFINIFPSCLILIGQWLITYKGVTASGYLDQSTIEVGIFKVLWNYNECNLKSFLYSLIVLHLYPILVFVSCYREKISISLSTKLAVANYIVQFFIFSIFYETGERMLHGNFSWGFIMASFLLFLNATIEMTKLQKKRIIISVLIIYFLSGIIYICRIGYNYL